MSYKSKSTCRECYNKDNPQKGGGNHNWRGGRLQNHDGYIKILLPNHPRADSKGYVFEHIVVWERFNGKPLPEGFIVHHINGIKSDNRPSNLVGLPNKKHIRLIALKERRIQELEALLKGQGQLI